jgi:hypothetical protein
MKTTTTTTKEKKMTFKVNSNDWDRVEDLASKLLDNNVRVSVKIDMSDMSNCRWGTGDGRLHTGGIGALLRDLQEACFAHGIIERPPHISNRNHVRLAINDRPIWTTSNGG